MLKLNSELRAQAREALQGNWVMAAVAALIYSAIVSATSYLPLVGTLLVGLPVAYGFTILMFSVIKGAKDIDLGILFEGFKDYSRIMGTVVLVFIYTFLWSLLLIIPGIIKHYFVCDDTVYSEGRTRNEKQCSYRKEHGYDGWQ